MAQASKSIEEPSSDWLTHERAACAHWEKGNLYEGLQEQEEALKLAPNNALVLINAGLMKQATEGYIDAIAQYRRATKLEPTNWIPWLGIARCYFLAGQEKKGIDALRSMGAQENRGFDWYYNVGQTCVKVNQLDLASKMAEKACAQASTPAQQKTARTLLLLTFLRTNKIDQAKPLQKIVFKETQPDNDELYARTAGQLLTASDASGGEELLQSAIKNLKAEEDWFAFFRLARIFEEKAGTSGLNASARDGWLANAQAAFEHAAKMNPSNAGTHQAIAEVLFRRNMHDAAVAELKKAQSIDPRDPLPPYLVSHSAPLNLSLVQFGFDERVCKCKVSHLVGIVRMAGGVAYAWPTGKKPFPGIALVESHTSLDDMFKTCAKTAFASAAASNGQVPPIQFEKVDSEKPINTPEAALIFAQNTKHGSPMVFDEAFVDYYNRFHDIQPITPKEDAEAPTPTALK